MATVTQVQEATNAEGQPIKLAVAYSDEVHNEVLLLRMKRVTGLNPNTVQVLGVSARLRHHNKVSTNPAF